MRAILKTVSWASAIKHVLVNEHRDDFVTIAAIAAKIMI